MRESSVRQSRRYFFHINQALNGKCHCIIINCQIVYKIRWGNSEHDKRFFDIEGHSKYKELLFIINFICDFTTVLIRLKTINEEI